MLFRSSLILDRIKPASQTLVNFKDGLKIVEKNKVPLEERANIVKIKDNIVFVKLGESGGYSFEYFSDYDVDSYFDGDFLVLNVGEKIR